MGTKISQEQCTTPTEHWRTTNGDTEVGGRTPASHCIVQLPSQLSNRFLYVLAMHILRAAFIYVSSLQLVEGF